MATIKEVLTETRDGVEYELEAVHYKGKCVGLAPTKKFIADGVEWDDVLEKLIEAYHSADVAMSFTRQLKQDVKNIVRAKFNKDKVSATTVINAIGSGAITAEMQTKAVEEMRSGKYKTFTDACAAYLGIGEDALKNADAEHIHWDCAR